MELFRSENHLNKKMVIELLHLFFDYAEAFVERLDELIGRLLLLALTAIGAWTIILFAWRNHKNKS